MICNTSGVYEFDVKSPLQEKVAVNCLIRATNYAFAQPSLFRCTRVIMWCWTANAQAHLGYGRQIMTVG